MGKTKSAYNKRRRGRTISIVIRILIGVIAACALVFLYLLIFTRVFNPTIKLYKTSLPPEAELSSSSSKLFYFTGSTLNCTDYYGEELWKQKFTGSDMKISNSDTLECVFNESAASIMDPQNNVLFTVPSTEYEFEDVSCGRNSIAILCSAGSERKAYYIRVFDMSGTEIYRSNYEDVDVLDFSLYGENDNLWALTLDCTGVSPISRISTSSPSQNALTGTIDITDQLISDVFYFDPNLYLSGTTNLVSYDTFGQKGNSTLVYGLKCIDYALSGSDYSLVYLPRSVTDITNAYTLRVLAHRESTEIDAFIQLPSDVIAVYSSPTLIYCYLKNSIYTYELTGEFSEEISLDFDVKDVVKLSSDRTLIYAEDGTVYYLIGS